MQQVVDGFTSEKHGNLHEASSDAEIDAYIYSALFSAQRPSPDGCEAGSTFLLDLDDGRQMEIAVPDGCGPGA